MTHSRDGRSNPKGGGHQQGSRLNEKIANRSEIIEKKMEAAKALMTQRIANGKLVAPTVKAAYAEYQSKFEAEASTAAGVEATQALAQALEGIPDGAPKTTVKPMQPEGMSISQLQRGCLKAATMVYTLLMLVHGAGSSVCNIEKSAGRAAEKAQQHGGGVDGIRKVTDFGRLTIAQATMGKLAAAFVQGKAILEKAGYQFILQKNTLDLKIDSYAAGGFRNLHTLVRNTKSGLIVEIQWALEALENIKHSPIGHIAYEVMRKSGLTLNSKVTGDVDSTMIEAIECGQVLTLDLINVSLTTKAAGQLVAALATPGCRVHDLHLYCPGISDTDAFVPVILAALAAVSVSKLWIGAHQNLTVAGWIRISEGLAATKSLTSVSTHWQNPDSLTTEGAVTMALKLAEAVAVNTSLTHIAYAGFDWVHIPEATWFKIADSLAASKSLKSISFTSNNGHQDGRGATITDAAWFRIADTIVAKKSLTSIALQNNTISEPVWAKIAEAVALNTSLTNLSVGAVSDKVTALLSKAWGGRNDKF